MNLGGVRDSPQWVDGVAILKYVDGDLCPDQIRKKSTIIRLTCSQNQVVSDTAFSALVLLLWGQWELKGHPSLGMRAEGLGVQLSLSAAARAAPLSPLVPEDRSLAPRRPTWQSWLRNLLVFCSVTQVRKGCRETGI